MAEFTKIIQAMNGGRLEQSLSALLYELVAVVAETHQRGSLTVKITASPGESKKGSDPRIVDVGVSAILRTAKSSSANEPVILYLGELLPLAEMQLQIHFEQSE